MKAFHFHKHEVDVGESIGFINVDYILHKTAVLLCNTVCLLFFRKEIEYGEIAHYIFLGYVICLVIVGARIFKNSISFGGKSIGKTSAE